MLFSGSLSALVYQHSVTPLALPCRLVLPESDLRLSNEPAQSTAHMLLTQGAGIFYSLNSLNCMYETLYINNVKILHNIN